MEKVFENQLFENIIGKIISGKEILDAVELINPGVEVSNDITTLAEVFLKENKGLITRIDDNKEKYNLRYLIDKEARANILTIYFTDILNCEPYHGCMIANTMINCIASTEPYRFSENCNSIRTWMKNVNVYHNLNMHKSDEDHLYLWNGYEISIIKSTTIINGINMYVYSALAVDTFGVNPTRTINKTNVNGIMEFLLDVLKEDINKKGDEN